MDRGLISTLELAVAGGLRLCVVDCFEADPHCLRNMVLKGRLDFVTLLKIPEQRESTTSSSNAKIAKCLIDH